MNGSIIYKENMKKINGKWKALLFSTRREKNRYISKSARFRKNTNIGRINIAPLYHSRSIIRPCRSLFERSQYSRAINLGKPRIQASITREINVYRCAKENEREREKERVGHPSDKRLSTYKESTSQRNSSENSRFWLDRVSIPRALRSRVWPSQQFRSISRTFIYPTAKSRPRPEQLMKSITPARTQSRC